MYWAEHAWTESPDSLRLAIQHTCRLLSYSCWWLMMKSWMIAGDRRYQAAETRIDRNDRRHVTHMDLRAVVDRSLAIQTYARFNPYNIIHDAIRNDCLRQSFWCNPTWRSKVSFMNTICVNLYLHYRSSATTKSKNFVYGFSSLRVLLITWTGFSNR
jgi:hypothetical protein